jgi:tRNA nucleotidyltransferase/poly(A) polymerase
MILCESDITTKNPRRMKRYLNNYQIVRKKLVEIEEKDFVKNLQPPVDGQEIMRIFNLPPGREIGIIKNRIKEAILDGHIKNNREEALALMHQIGAELGLSAVKNSSL